MRVDECTNGETWVSPKFRFDGRGHKYQLTATYSMCLVQLPGNEPAYQSTTAVLTEEVGGSNYRSLSWPAHRKHTTMIAYPRVENLKVGPVSSKDIWYQNVSRAMPCSPSNSTNHCIQSERIDTVHSFTSFSGVNRDQQSA